MGNSFLLIVVGLLLFYLVISDKWKCVEGFAACVLGRTQPSTQVAPTTQPITAPLPSTLNNLNWFSGSGFPDYVI